MHPTCYAISRGVYIIGAGAQHIRLAMSSATALLQVHAEPAQQKARITSHWGRGVPLAPLPAPSRKGVPFSMAREENRCMCSKALRAYAHIQLMRSPIGHTHAFRLVMCFIELIRPFGESVINITDDIMKMSNKP